MPPRPSQGSQSWLAGADNTLDNYFKSSGVASAPSTSKRATNSGSKRKRDPPNKRNASNEVNGPFTKRVKTCRPEDSDATHTRQARPTLRMDSTSPNSKGKGKGKARQALGDLTSALQNSPHRQRVSTSDQAKDKSKAVIQLDDEDGSSSEPESGTANASKRLPALTYGKTPCRPLKRVANCLSGHLPTPPSSSMLPSRSLVTDERGSSPTSHLTSPNKEQQQQSNNVEKLAAQTPFAFVVASSKRGYPTPTSIAVPRLNLTRPTNAEDNNPAPPLPAPNLNLDFDSDSPLTSLSSSSPAKSTKSDHDEAVEDCGTKTNDAPRVSTTTPRKDKGKLRSYLYEVIPSSQTQYIHYSPTKKKTRNESSEDRIQCSFAAGRNKALDLTVIPCSQSQSSSSSFEVLPPQRNESQVNAAGLSVSVSPTLRRQRQRSVLNLVVPTSQEDEIEISLMDGSGSLPRFSQLVREYSSMVGVSDTKAGEERLSVGTRSQQRIEEKSQANNELKSSAQTGPSQSTQMRFINAILDDFDRLAEETRLNTTTASQVLARPRARISNPSSSSLSSGSNSSRGRRQNLFMQSSVTEPDSSQWEDPFSLTNEAYARHLGLRVSRPSTNTATTSRRHREWENAEGLPLSQPTCTQSSATQPDSDEEDPFPTLPPPPAPPSTAETISHKGAGGSQAQSETESETENEDEGCGNGDDVDGATSMPDITSPDDTFDFRLLSPCEVMRVVEGGMRFRRRDKNSLVLQSHSRRRGEGRDDDEEREDGDRGRDEDEGVEEVGEEMPNTVREFLRMLDTQNQSLDWSQSQTPSGI